MVGTPTTRQIKDAVDFGSALVAIVENKDLLSQLKAEADRLEAAAAAFGVGKDLAEAQGQAKKIIDKAHETARSIEAECGRLKAQAEQILSAARKEKSEADSYAASRKKELDDRADELDRRDGDLKGDADKNASDVRANVAREKELAAEAKRLQAWNDRLEAAVRGS